VVTRVPEVAQADNSAQATTAASNPLFAFIMATFLMKMRVETLASGSRLVIMQISMTYPPFA
jgi:hypothetical protein